MGWHHMFCIEARIYDEPSGRDWCWDDWTDMGLAELQGPIAFRNLRHIQQENLSQLGTPERCALGSTGFPKSRVSNTTDLGSPVIGRVQFAAGAGCNGLLLLLLLLWWSSFAIRGLAEWTREVREVAGWRGWAQQSTWMADQKWLGQRLQQAEVQDAGVFEKAWIRQSQHALAWRWQVPRCLTWGFPGLPIEPWESPRS